MQCMFHTPYILLLIGVIIDGVDITPMLIMDVSLSLVPLPPLERGPEGFN